MGDAATATALNATPSNAIASSSKMPMSSVQHPHAATLLKREATEDISTDVDGDDDDEEDDDDEGGRSRDGAAIARGDSRSALTEGGRGPDGAPIKKKKSASKKKKANRACAACQKAHLTCDDGELSPTILLASTRFCSTDHAIRFCTFLHPVCQSTAQLDRVHAASRRVLATNVPMGSANEQSISWMRMSSRR